MLALKRLQQRAALLRALRSFFSSNSFLEVDTPLRQPVIIPERYIEPLRSEEAYLQTSPELCMKRLLASGCDKIFQICPCFRKNESGRRHLEEFTMLEWYRTDSDYEQLMVDCRNLFLFILSEMQELEFGGKASSLFSGLDLTSPWEVLTVEEAFHRFCPVSMDQALDQDKFDELLVEYVEPQLGQNCPTFLKDYPVELGSLAKESSDKPGFVERFELYLSGVELANGFTELTDEVEQRKRFGAEIESIRKSWGPDIAMPERFLADIKKLDSAAGIALGVDRLFMLAFNIENIGEAVSFTPEDSGKDK